MADLLIFAKFNFVSVHSRTTPNKDRTIYTSMVTIPPWQAPILFLYYRFFLLLKWWTYQNTSKTLKCHVNLTFKICVSLKPWKWIETVTSNKCSFITRISHLIGFYSMEITNLHIQSYKYFLITFFCDSFLY